MPQRQGVTLGPCPWGRGIRDLSKEELQPEEKYWLVGAYNLGVLSAQELRKRFNLSSKLVSSWARGVANGVNLYSKGGRPSFLEDEDLETLRREMTNQVVQVTPRQFQERVKELYEARQISKGVARRDIVKLSNRYFSRLEAKLGVSTSKSHVTTDARVLAVHDLRNAVTMAAMNQAVVPLSHASLITNVDSTVMVAGRKYESEGEALFIGPRPPNVKTTEDEDTAKENVICIKLHLLINALRTAGTTVFVISHDNMGPDDVE
jgi:transposase